MDSDPPLLLAHHAMGTRFEFILSGSNPVALRAAAEEAFEEIDRLERQLSLYQPDSELSRLNARAAFQPVKVEPRLFSLLCKAQSLHAQSSGAFDISIGPLLGCWGFIGGSGQLPSPDALALARACTGMDLVSLHEEEGTIRFLKPGVMLDLGSIGKGYALERAADILQEAGVENALLHGGTSTVLALGRPAEEENWKIAIPFPGPVEGRATLKSCIVPLHNQSLSVSAVWGKSFTVDNKRFGHVLDPRTGQPASQAVLAAVVLPSATETDALSTALLLEGAAGLTWLQSQRPQVGALVISQEILEGPCQVSALGLDIF